MEKQESAAVLWRELWFAVVSQASFLPLCFPHKPIPCPLGM